MSGTEEYKNIYAFTRGHVKEAAEIFSVEENKIALKYIDVLTEKNA